MMQSFEPFDSSESGALSNYWAFKRELIGKLVFDDPRVFQRLAVHRISPEFVGKCAQSFHTDKNLLDAKRQLQEVTAAAVGISSEDMEEQEEIQRHMRDSMGNKKFMERKMYKPLTSMFRHVENFPDSSNTSPKHSFECTNSTVLKSDTRTLGFQKGSPDFVILDRSSSSPVVSGKKHVLWRHNVGFCEIKPTAGQGPKPVKPEIVKELVCQAADFARLHLSARPFQLFSVGLLIFGSQFCVAIFDRAGVIFSPIHDLWKDTEMFIRVVRSLTCHLSPVELGRDPTVFTLTDEGWRNQTRALGLEVPKDFPTFVVSVGGSRWYTVGLPIWTPISLLGEGTCIWLVQENGKGPLVVLKNMWRGALWTSDSIIYGSVDGHHPALAKLRLVEGVCFPNEKRYVTVRNLRGLPPDQDISGGDVFLHRVLFETRGRPLWEYRSEKELVQGVRAALNAHEFLCKKGILHRDVSPGNIILAIQAPPEAGVEGFLMDWEFGCLGNSSINTTTKILVPPVRVPGGAMTEPTITTHTTFGPNTMRGPARTGTAQFMAAEILGSIYTKVPIEHQAKHDIESFIFVLAFAVTKRAVLNSHNLDQDTRTELLEFFYSTFGRTRLSEIWSSRDGQTPLSVTSMFPGLLSTPMTELLDDLKEWLRHSTLSPKFNPPKLTHALVSSVLEAAIAKMD